MLKLKTIALLFLSAIAFNAHAQKTGYIITNSGDTIKCKVRYVTLSSNIRFKTDTMKEYQEESPTTIKQYYRQKDKYPYRSVVLPGKKDPRFVSVIEDGNISIYEQASKQVMSSFNPAGGMFTPYSSNVTFWYMQKGDGPVLKIKTNQLINFRSKKDRKSDFEAMIADKPEVLKLYESADSFSFDLLKDIVHYYNTGEAPKPKVTEPAEPAVEPVTEGN
ncbi:hypothetical protein KHS38_03735 [Mucilaginibacter sp. Bleaf8]|uniref:hypothetical protein n=1 Tax=Mucilaginibacter sp. Bleaf8 TaxID=2834430 RepID=UPI001BCC8A65|nr:hypothetical protein [Mucilaginibacter sp. Bleaf8]MBS7563507.1 hypothetical protein [Mucilaginibacter sp. Bleaf8]